MFAYRSICHFCKLIIFYNSKTGLYARFFLYLPMKSILIIIVFFVTFVSTIHAQVDSLNTRNSLINKTDSGSILKTISKDSSLVFVEQMPQFPGGNNALSTFINNNLHYPPAARENNIQGKVFLKFMIDTNGQIQHVQNIKNAPEILFQEASRVINLSPRWTPGYQKGKPVSVYFVLPITFSLEDSSPKKMKPHFAAMFFLALAAIIGISVGLSL